MQLQIVEPVTTIAGFSADIYEQPGNLIEGSWHETLLIDYHIKVTATCTGENPRYGEAGEVSFLISQFTDQCSIGLQTESDDEYILMVLEVYQIIQAIRIVEGSLAGKKHVFFVLSVKDIRNNSTSSFVWTLRKEV